MFEKILSVLRIISPVIIGSGVGAALYFFKSAIAHNDDQKAQKRAHIAFLLFAFVFAYAGLVAFSPLAKGICFACSAISLIVCLLKK